MPFLCSRLWVFGVCAALVAGCGGGAGTTGGGGGGGGGGGNNSTAVTVTFPAGKPTAVAAKIGTGAFTAQTLSGNTLTLTLPSGTNNYAIGAVCPSLGSTGTEFVWEASTTDGVSLNFYCQSASQSTGALTGSLDATAIPGVEQFVVYSQNKGSVSWGGEGPDYGEIGGPTASFNLPAVAGADRILVLAQSNQGLVGAKSFINQTVPGALNGGNTVVFATADEVAPEGITYSNVPSGFSSPSTYVSLQMAGSGIGGSLSSVAVAGPVTTQYPALPATAIESGDEYSFEAAAFALVGSVSSAVIAGATNSGGPVSLAFPAPWSYTGPTPAALPTATFNYTGFSGSTDVFQSLSVAWEPSSTAASLIEVTASASYQSGSTTLAVPDLSGLPGFLASPASGKQLEWSASITRQSYGLTSTGAGVANAAPLNATYSIVENNGSFTVP